MSTFKDGVWHNNPGFVQLLGLCPLLAISNTVVNAISLGLATILTLTIANFLVSSIKHYLDPAIRIPIFVLVIASIVTSIELLMHAYFYELYIVLGIFIPLIVTNCCIIGRAEAFASRNSVLQSIIDGFANGLGFTLALIILAAIREILGFGTLLRQAELLFGDTWKNFELVIIPDFDGFLLAILPPGAFICLGLIIAGCNWLIIRKNQATSLTQEITNEPTATR